MEARNLIESNRFPSVTSKHGIDEIKLSAKFSDAVHPLVEYIPMPFGKVVELLRDVSLQLVVSTVANPRKHDSLPRREGHTAQTELAGFTVRLYPFTRRRELEEPKAIVIDPEVSFAKPVLVGTGILTATVAERYKAGESVEELVADYDMKQKEIEEGIRFELRAA